MPALTIQALPANLQATASEAAKRATEPGPLGVWDRRWDDPSLIQPGPFGLPLFDSPKYPADKKPTKVEDDDVFQYEKYLHNRLDSYDGTIAQAKATLECGVPFDGLPITETPASMLAKSQKAEARIQSELTNVAELKRAMGIPTDGT